MTMILAILTILGFSFMAFADDAPVAGGDASGGSSDTNTDASSSTTTEVGTDDSSEDISELSLDSESKTTFDEPEDEEEIPSKDVKDKGGEKPDEKTTVTEPKKESVKDETVRPDEKSQVFEPEFISKAKKLGFTEAEVKSFGTPERFVGRLNAIVEKYKASQKPKEPEKPTDGKIPETKEKSVDDDFNLDSDDYDPEFKKMGSVVKSQRSQIVELTNRLKAIEERSNQEFSTLSEERKSQFLKWYDSEMDSLGKENPDIFGDTSTGHINPNTHKVNRDAIMEDMVVLASGYRSLGKAIPSHAELLKKAIQARFGDQLTKKEKTKALEEIRSEVDANKKKAIHRPNGNHNNKSTDPDKEAKEYVKSQLKEFGVKVSDDDDDDVSELSL